MKMYRFTTKYEILALKYFRKNYYKSVKKQKILKKKASSAFFCRIAA
jgi:hypothetical protein